MLQLYWGDLPWFFDQKEADAWRLQQAENYVAKGSKAGHESYERRNVNSVMRKLDRAVFARFYKTCATVI